MPVWNLPFFSFLLLDLFDSVDFFFFGSEEGLAPEIAAAFPNVFKRSDWNRKLKLIEWIWMNWMPFQHLKTTAFVGRSWRCSWRCCWRLRRGGRRWHLGCASALLRQVSVLLRAEMQLVSRFRAALRSPLTKWFLHLKKTGRKSGVLCFIGGWFHLGYAHLVLKSTFFFPIFPSGGHPKAQGCQNSQLFLFTHFGCCLPRRKQHEAIITSSIGFDWIRLGSMQSPDVFCRLQEGGTSWTSAQRDSYNLHLVESSKGLLSHC